VTVGNTHVPLNPPRLLFDGDSPFSLRWAAPPAPARWLIRFLCESMPHWFAPTPLRSP
jgi:D-amino-acid dehydrogenase